MDLPKRIYHGPEVERLYRDLLAARSLSDAPHHTSHESGGSDAIKLDDLAAPDDNTDLDASTSKHGLLPKLPNDSARFLNGVGGYSTPGIGGFQVWFPDAPPVSAHACDDEMDGSSVDAKWTEWDPSASIAFSMDTTRHMLKAVQTGNGGVRWGGLYQAVPGSEFSIYAKVHPLFAAPQTSGMGVGIFVSDDIATNPTTADFREIDLGMSTSVFSGIQVRTWTAYNGTASAAVSKLQMPTPYIRIRCNGTSFWSENSPDGVTWFVNDATTLGFTPTHMGICFTVVQNTVEGTGLVTFFRCLSGAGASGYNSTYIGRFV